MAADDALVGSSEYWAVPNFASDEKHAPALLSRVGRAKDQYLLWNNSIFNNIILPSYFNTNKQAIFLGK